MTIFTSFRKRERRLHMSSIVAYGMLSMATAFVPNCIAASMNLYVEDLHVPITFLARLNLLVRLMDLIAGFIVGHASDVCFTPLGKRKPFMAFGLPCLVGWPRSCLYIHVHAHVHVHVHVCNRGMNLSLTHTTHTHKTPATKTPHPPKCARWCVAHLQLQHYRSVAGPREPPRARG